MKRILLTVLVTAMCAMLAGCGNMSKVRRTVERKTDGRNNKKQETTARPFTMLTPEQEYDNTPEPTSEPATEPIPEPTAEPTPEPSEEAVVHTKILPDAATKDYTAAEIYACIQTVVAEGYTAKEAL